MKIVHVISALTKGGGERVVAELANVAAEKGDEVTVLAAWPVDPSLLQNAISPKVSVKFVAADKIKAYLNIIPWIIKNRRWLCNQDVLHCHLTFGALFGCFVKIILRVLLRNKRPVVVETYHAVGMSIPKFNQWLHAMMIKMRDGLVLMATDPYWNNFIKKNTGLTYKLIPNGIAMLNPVLSEDKKAAFKKELKITAECKYLVGTVSQLRSDRKPLSYIPVSNFINKELGNKVHFVLGGDGVEMEKIKTAVSESGLENVFHLPGLVSVPADTISNFDVYVSVSVGKTTGISMIEAAMCHVPVIGIQLVEGYTAAEDDWVWSHTNLEEVARRVVYLLLNEGERMKLAGKQYEYVKNNFTSDAMYSSYNDFYTGILSAVKP